MLDSVLTDQETAELSRFSKGRARIQSHLALLASRPTLDPFAHFVPVWETSSEAHLAAAWSDLDGRLEEVKEWMAERDQIEDEASEFDAEDMEKLRKMAKVASDRSQLSTTDTDIVEVALETIVSLEKLRSLLEVRALSLSLYFSRLTWDAQRRDCWTTYAALIKEANDIVVRDSQWPVGRAPEKHDSKDDHVRTARTQSLATGKDIRDVSQLCAKICQFSEIQVPSTGACLDAVIEQLQVPEEFIDEQDRIDALADEMMSQSGFLGELLQQWQKTDLLYVDIRRVDALARSLILEVERAKATSPTVKFAQSFAQSSLELSRSLELLCGPSAHDFLGGADRASRRLCVISDHILAPRHKRWPAQDTVNDSTKYALDEELIAAAKQARRAICATDAYQEMIRAVSQREEAGRRLLDAVQACARIESECHSEWPASSIAKTSSDKAALIVLDAAKSSTTPPLDRLSTTFAKLQGRLSTIEGEAESAQADLTDSLLKCRSLGFGDIQQRQVDEQSAAWDAQHASTKAVLLQAVSIVHLLELIEKVEQELAQSEAAMQSAVARLTKIVESSCFRLLNTGSEHQSSGSDHSDGHLASEAADAAYTATTSLVAFHDHPLASLVPETINILRQRCSRLSTQSLQVKQLAKWTVSVSHQAESAALVQRQFDGLCQDAEQVRGRCDLLLHDETTSRDEVEQLQSSQQELQASIIQFTASQVQDVALVGPAPDVSSLSIDGKPILLACSDGDVRDASNTWCLTLARKQQGIEEALQLLVKKVDDTDFKDTGDGKATLPDRRASQSYQTAGALQKASDKPESAACLSPAESSADYQGPDDVQYAERSASHSTSPSRSTSVTFPSPCLPTTPGHSAKQRAAIEDDGLQEDQPYNQAQSKTYVALAAAVRDCEQELGRRERSFTKVLESKASRRLPPRAFISELGNRRNDAEEKLTLRLEVVRSALELLQDTVALGESASTVTSAQQEAAQIASAVQDLLRRLDGVIIAEGGDTPLLSGQPLHIASELSRSRSSVSSLSAHLEGQFRISAATSTDIARSRSAPSLPPTNDVEESPSSSVAPVEEILTSTAAFIEGSLSSSVAPTGDSLSSSAAPIETQDAGSKIAKLTARLTDGEVETQTIIDGLAQMKAYLDFPSDEHNRRVQEEWEQLRGEVDLVVQQNRIHPAAANLETLSTQREEKVNRFRLLTVFSETAAECETALASFLDLLDQLGNESFGEGLRSSSPSSVYGTKQIARAAESLSYTTQDTLEGGIGDAQRTRAALAALEPILERAKRAAAPVSQDVRVKGRLAQIDRSYVDMAEMASDVLNPGLQRSSSVSSLASTISRGSSSASLPPSPVMSMSSKFGFSAASTAAAPAADRAARPLVSPAPSASSLLSRSRKTSLASSITYQAPTATALRALRRKSAAHKTAPSEEGDQEAMASQIPRRRSSASPSPATPRAPTAARTRLTSITGSPATPTASSRPNPGSDPFGTPTPSRLRAPSTFARPSSMGTSTPRTPSSVNPSTSARRRPPSMATPNLSERPNRYRANPKSKLDVAVAQTINRLSVPVKIEAVKPSGNASYEDHSGKYWVGHPDPRLCFCRILRSRTIMVRVGGGWQELTRYLMQHHGLSSTSVELGQAQTSPASARTSPNGTRASAKKTTTAIPWLSSSTSMEQGQFSDPRTSPPDLPRRLQSQKGDISSPIFLPSQWSPTLSRKMQHAGEAAETPTRSERKRVGSSATAAEVVEATGLGLGAGLGFGLRADNGSRHVRKSFSTSSPAPVSRLRDQQQQQQQQQFQIQMKAPASSRLPSHSGGRAGRDSVDPDDSLGSIRSVYFR